MHGQSRSLRAGRWTGRPRLTSGTERPEPAWHAANKKAKSVSETSRPAGASRESERLVQTMLEPCHGATRPTRRVITEDDPHAPRELGAVAARPDPDSQVGARDCPGIVTDTIASRTHGRRIGGEHTATNQCEPTRDDTRRQGQRHDRSIAAGQQMAMLAFIRQRSQMTRSQHHSWLGSRSPRRRCRHRSRADQCPGR
jgi:hypothetical protein